MIDFNQWTERAQQDGRYKLHIVTGEPITAEQALTQLNSGAVDVIFVPEGMDAPGERPEGIMLIVMNDACGFFAFLRKHEEKRESLESMLSFVSMVVNGEDGKGIKLCETEEELESVLMEAAKTPEGFKEVAAIFPVAGLKLVFREPSVMAAKLGKKPDEIREWARQELYDRGIMAFTPEEAARLGSAN